MRPVWGAKFLADHGNPEVMPLDQCRDAEDNGSNQASIDHHIPVGLATYRYKSRAMST
jgi:hypothetical protein